MLVVAMRRWFGTLVSGVTRWALVTMMVGAWFGCPSFGFCEHGLCGDGVLGFSLGGHGGLWWLEHGQCPITSVGFITLHLPKRNTLFFPTYLNHRKFDE